MRIYGVATVVVAYGKRLQQKQQIAPKAARENLTSSAERRCRLQIVNAKQGCCECTLMQRTSGRCSISHGNKEISNVSSKKARDAVCFANRKQKGKRCVVPQKRISNYSQPKR